MVKKKLTNLVRIKGVLMKVSDVQSYQFSSRKGSADIYKLGFKTKDKALMQLIGKYLRAGIMDSNGQYFESRIGVPQGSPLSPLLLNVVLDELDKELERRGHRFARYADDCVPRRRIEGQSPSCSYAA